MTVQRLLTLALTLAVGLLPGGGPAAELPDDYCPSEVNPSVICEDDWPCHLITQKVDDGGCWTTTEETS